MKSPLLKPVLTVGIASLSLGTAVLCPGSADARSGPQNAPLPPIRLPNTPRSTDRLPYTQWTRHLGPAADALVTAEVTLKDSRTQEVTTQKGAGIIVRCDGLILLPACLFYTPGNADRARRETVMSVTLHAQAVQGKDLPAAFTADVPRYRSPRAPFVLVKTREVRERHFRAAALLHPRNLAGSGKVTVVYPLFPASDDGKSTERTVSAAVRVIEKPENGGASLTFASADGTVAPILPPGAIVIDEESKMAIGIYAPPDVSPVDAVAPASDADLTTFAPLHEVTNAIGLVPKPDDRLGEAPQARKPGTVEDGMVWIPGGPREIRPTEWQELQGAPVACLPGFWIDREEVTVREYRKFLLLTKYQPQGQIPGAATAPVIREEDAGGKAGANPGIDPDSLPVRGLTVADAEAYAAWAEKRLVTPIEWMWASLGAGLAPVEPITAENGLAVYGRTDKGTFRTPRHGDGRAQHKLINDINRWVAAAAPPWSDAYERGLDQAESELRIRALLAAYIESKFWSFWQSPFGPEKFFKAPPEYTRIPLFQELRNDLTPGRSIADPRYLAAMGAINRPANSGELLPARWFLDDPVSPRRDAMEVSQDVIESLFHGLAVAPVGSRRYDRSVFDVRDISTNLPEWVQANHAVGPEERAAKALPAMFDPVRQPDWREAFDDEVTRRVSEFNVALNGGDRFNFGAVRSNIAFTSRLDPFNPDSPGHSGPYAYNVGLLITPSLSKDIDLALTQRRMTARYPTPLLPFLRLSHPENAPDIGTGFRCAR